VSDISVSICVSNSIRINIGVSGCCCSRSIWNVFNDYLVFVGSIRKISVSSGSLCGRIKNNSNAVSNSASRSCDGVSSCVNFR